MRREGTTDKSVTAGSNRRRVCRMAAFWLVVIFGMTACGGLTAGKGQSEGVLPENVKQSGNDMQPESTEKEDRQMSGYPVITEVASKDDVDFVLESEGIYCILTGEHYGYQAESGEEIAPFIYQGASPFSEGLACVRLDGKYGYIDHNGETALDFVYDYAAPFSEGLAYFSMGDIYGFIGTSGEQMFTLECDSVSSFREGLAYFSIDGKYGYIDRTGAVVIQPVYDDADYFHDGLARVRVGGHYGVIDIQGREMLPAVYEGISFEEEYVLAKKDGMTSCYVFDEKGAARLLLEEAGIYKQQGAGRNLFTFVRDDCQGLADGEGTILIEPAYRWLNLLENTERVVAAISEGEEYLYGVLDFHGNEIVPFGEYDYIYSYGDGMAAGLLEVRQNGEEWKDNRYGIIDADGNPVYDVMYDKVSVCANGSVVLWKGDVVSLYDVSGRLLYVAEDCKNVSLQGECYQVELEKGGRYLSPDGEWVNSEYFDYLASYCTIQPEITVGCRSKSRNVIIKTQVVENSAAETGGVILKNSVTPRITPFYEKFLERMNHGKDSYQQFVETGTRQLFRLYGADGGGQPLLYYYEEPYRLSTFPTSISSFYQIQGGQAVEIVRGEECGGSARGDYATLWYDRETGRILPGAYGTWGGFGGFAFGGYICTGGAAGFELTDSFYSTKWYSSSIAADWIFESPELIYNDAGEPYPADALPTEDGAVTVYTTNGVQKMISVEDFRKMQNRYVELYSVRY